MGSPRKKHVEVRRLRAAQAKNYRSLLVEALIVHPDCFVEDYREELARPITETEQELERSGVFGAWEGNRLIGIAAEVPCTTMKRRHCGQLRNLYVRREYRRNGVARRLIQEVLAYCSRGVERLEAEIPAQCETAVQLFEEHGFRLYGLSPNGIRIGPEALDVWTMIRTL